MLDYSQKIKQFLEDNFKPSTPEDANYRVNSLELMLFLYDTFPTDCIDEYEMEQILTQLGYKRFVYDEVTKFNYIDDKGQPIEKERHKFKHRWCMYSEIIAAMPKETENHS